MTERKELNLQSETLTVPRTTAIESAQPRAPGFVDDLLRAMSWGPAVSRALWQLSLSDEKVAVFTQGSGNPGLRYFQFLQKILPMGDTAVVDLLTWFQMQITETPSPVS